MCRSHRDPWMTRILDSSLRSAAFGMTGVEVVQRSPRGEEAKHPPLNSGEPGSGQAPPYPARAGDGFPTARERRFGCTGRWPRLARLGSGPLIPSSSSGQAPPSPARGEGVRGTGWAAGRVQTQMSVRLGGGMPASRLLSISLFTQTLSPFGVERRRRLGRSRRYDLGSAGAYSQMYLP